MAVGGEALGAAAEAGILTAGVMCCRQAATTSGSETLLWVWVGDQVRSDGMLLLLVRFRARTSLMWSRIKVEGAKVCSLWHLGRPPARHLRQVLLLVRTVTVMDILLLVALLFDACDVGS